MIDFNVALFFVLIVNQNNLYLYVLSAPFVEYTHPIMILPKIILKFLVALVDRRHNKVSDLLKARPSFFIYFVVGGS